jgi:hypothetical protein
VIADPKEARLLAMNRRFGAVSPPLYAGQKNPPALPLGQAPATTIRRALRRHARVSAGDDLKRRGFGRGEVTQRVYEAQYARAKFIWPREIAKAAVAEKEFADTHKK